MPVTKLQHYQNNSLAKHHATNSLLHIFQCLFIVGQAPKKWPFNTWPLMRNILVSGPAPVMDTFLHPEGVRFQTASTVHEDVSLTIKNKV